MADGMRANSSAQLLFGFVAGLLATVIFHQLALALLWIIGVAPSGPFPMAATRPFGVPAVFSLAFWGGVWVFYLRWFNVAFLRAAPTGLRHFFLAPSCRPWLLLWWFYR